MVRPKRLTPEAFAKAFQAASRRLWCLAAAVLGGPALAEDVLQEAAVTALARLQSFESGTNFDAWMGKIVRFTALNQARRHYHAKELGVDEWLAATGAPAERSQEADPEELVAPHQMHFDDTVMRALRQLSETARTSFLLRVVMGLSYEEISSLLDIPQGTAMSHVHRSRASMRKSLEEDAAFEPLAVVQEKAS